MENRSSAIWIVLKYVIIGVISLLFVVLAVQLISIANLRRSNSNLSGELNSTLTEREQKQNQLDELQNNFDKFVEDQAKENLNMAGENEEVLIGAN